MWAIWSRTRHAQTYILVPVGPSPSEWQASHCPSQGQREQRGQLLGAKTSDISQSATSRIPGRSKRAFASFRCKRVASVRAIQPPRRLGDLVGSRFSHPRFPFVSTDLSAGGHHSDTRILCEASRTADAMSCATAALTCAEGSKSKGMYTSKTLGCHILSMRNIPL